MAPRSASARMQDHELASPNSIAPDREGSSPSHPEDWTKFITTKPRTSIPNQTSIPTTRGCATLSELRTVTSSSQKPGLDRGPRVANSTTKMVTSATALSLTSSTSLPRRIVTAPHSADSRILKSNRLTHESQLTWRFVQVECKLAYATRRSRSSMVLNFLKTWKNYSL